MPAQTHLNSKEKYLTLTQAAEILDVNIATVRRWTNSGKLKSLRTQGGHRRLFKHDIEKILEKKRRKQEGNQLKAKSTTIVVPTSPATSPIITQISTPPVTTQNTNTANTQ